MGQRKCIPDGDGIQFPIVHAEMDLSRFFLDNHNLGGIGTVRWLNDPLSKPDVMTFAHLSLKLCKNCLVWEVYRLISASGNSVG